MESSSPRGGAAAAAIFPFSVQAERKPVVPNSPKTSARSSSNNNTPNKDQYEMRDYTSTPRSSSSSTPEKVLDGFLLLDRCHVELPDEANRADVSGLDISAVEEEDLQYFSNLISLNMSDNVAPFEPFGNFPSLLELDFQCNAVKNIPALRENAFSRLELLDLSHNYVSRESLLNLTALRRLRELHLGSNSIRRLPPIMDKFEKLEVLSLEHNSLSSSDDLLALSSVPKLKHLNLSYNKLRYFPTSVLTRTDEDDVAFKALTYLNLAHNAITDEDDIVGVTILSHLRHLVLYGNPVAHHAVMPQDPTKLAYDPIPSITYKDDDTDELRNPDLNIILAYPPSSKKNSMSSSYKSFKMKQVPKNQIPSAAAFKSKGNRLLFNSPEKKEEQAAAAAESSLVEERIKDNTFLTGVDDYDLEEEEEALEYNEFPELQSRITAHNFKSDTSSTVPTSLFARSLCSTGSAAPRKVDQAKLRSAVSQLRHHLKYPSQTLDDVDLRKLHSMQPTKSQRAREDARKALNKRNNLL